MQLGEREGRRADRPVCGDDGQRDDGLPGPAAEGIDVEGQPPRQEHDLGRHLRQPFPRPPAEQREPDPGEDPGGGDAAGRPDPARGGHHVRGARVVARELEGDIRLDGGGQLGRSAVEGGPGAVLALVGADPFGGGLGLLLGPDPEELPEQ